MEPRRVVICRQISNYFLVPKGERLAVSLKLWWGKLISEKVTEGRYLYIIVVVIINVHNYDDTEKEGEKGGGRRVILVVLL
jgi:CRISPR/Cas system endoribonuclease Cas6 (RAMP superfamily)